MTTNHISPQYANAAASFKNKEISILRQKNTIENLNKEIKVLADLSNFLGKINIDVNMVDSKHDISIEQINSRLQNTDEEYESNKKTIEHIEKNYYRLVNDTQSYLELIKFISDEKVKQIEDDHINRDALDFQSRRCVLDDA
jgi:Flp pilus assembly CpaF family ATPase